MKIKGTLEGANRSLLCINFSKIFTDDTNHPYLLVVQKHFIFSLTLFCASKLKMKLFELPPCLYISWFENCLVLDTLDVRYLPLVPETIQNVAKYRIWKRFLIWVIFLTHPVYNKLSVSPGIQGPQKTDNWGDYYVCSPFPFPRPVLSTVPDSWLQTVKTINRLQKKLIMQNTNI